MDQTQGGQIGTGSPAFGGVSTASPASVPVLLSDLLRSGDGVISTYSILDNTGGGSVPQPFPRDIRNSTHPLQSVLQRHPLPPPTPPLPPPPIRPPKGTRGRGRGRSRASVGRGKLQQQSLLRQQPSLNPMKSPMVLPPKLMRLQKALNLEPYVRYVESLPVDHKTRESESETDSDVLDAAEEEVKRLPVTKLHVACFDRMKKRKRFIETADLATDDSEDNCEVEGAVDEKEFLGSYQNHLRRKRQRRKVRKAPDDEPDNEPKSDRLLIDVEGNEGKRRKKKRKKASSEATAAAASDRSSSSKAGSRSTPGGGTGGGGEKLQTKDQKRTTRRRFYASIMKREIGKSQKARNYNQKERLANAKRVANACMKFVRAKAMASAKAAKEANWRAKRLTREMQAYWKRVDKAEKIQKRQKDKVAEDQRKVDMQLLDVKRQQRKLNFLVTQTELYAHFMAKKLNRPSDDEDEDKEAKEILDRLQENRSEGRLAEIDSYDCDAVKATIENNASQAVHLHEVKKSSYEIEAARTGGPVSGAAGERSQPEIFNGELKNYQLKGMNWLVDLYDQGINGILADEMGLGKTVQALAMLSYVAEKYNIWGPFLVITPASTLHNWQQEIARFVPSFKVVPYWGSPQERKILRHFWDQKYLHTRDASFHVVITSYQLVITDYKYFNRIKWQYVVLDEAQAIKSSGSIRWKMLLEFKCRNRLLLSGTPIQNSMAELWALLHFVMPTLFDSHDEFQDWFSKDIESSAEGSKGQIDEEQMSRLHMILKPFMLRRIKKDVENELSDKLEVLLYCPLTIRQKLLYRGLKGKIKIEELLAGLGSQSQNSTIATSLMNLVMQFRKVCNHPELFERREARSPLTVDIGPFLLPRLLANHHGDRSAPKQRLLYNRLCIFNPAHVHRSLFTSRSRSGQDERLEVSDSAFSFLRFVDTSPGELYERATSLLALLMAVMAESKRRLARDEEIQWRGQGGVDSKDGSRRQRLLLCSYSRTRCIGSSECRGLAFTTRTGTFLHHVDATLRPMPETAAHRQIRMRSQRHRKSSSAICDIEFKSRLEVPLRCQPCEAPKFLCDETSPRVATPGRLPYASDRRFSYRVIDHNANTNIITHGSTNDGSARVYQEETLHLGSFVLPEEEGGIRGSRPESGWSNIVIPSKQTLVSDSGKLHVLDGLLDKLKSEGHRVLIYSQMTKMIDLLEEYMWHRKHTFMRLDGSSKISERRDMVADFQERSDIFVFLLSTRAGGLGINLTAADTVIFYDSDWNPTVDQQAMDRAHRLGQTKQVTVYRLICKGTIEERILQRAKEKSEIHRMVIQGGSFKGYGKQGDQLKPKEVVSLLLDDDEIERKYKAKADSSTTGSAEATIAVGDNEDSSDAGGAVSSSENVDSGSQASSRDRTRPPSPLLDFMGEKIGPKRSKKSSSGSSKRGRPRGTKRGLDREEQQRIAAQIPQHNGMLIPAKPMGTTPPTKRGPGRPRLRPQGVPMNLGGRSPTKSHLSSAK